MIVGKVEHPTRFHSGLGLGFDFSAIDFKSNVLKTQYNAFTAGNFYGSYTLGVDMNSFWLGLNFIYSYSSYDKTITDQNGKNPQDVEKFHSQSYYPNLCFSKGLSVLNRYEVFGLGACYTPYIHTQFSGLKNISSGKLNETGSAVSANIFLARGPLGFYIRYARRSYTDLVTTEGSMGFDIWVGFF